MFLHAHEPCKTDASHGFIFYNFSGNELLRLLFLYESGKKIIIIESLGIKT